MDSARAGSFPRSIEGFRRHDGVAPAIELDEARGQVGAEPNGFARERVDDEVPVVRRRGNHLYATPGTGIVRVPANAHGRPRACRAMSSPNVVHALAINRTAPSG